MICYVLSMGKQHLGSHVVVGYGIKIFWPGLFITSSDHLVNIISYKHFVHFSQALYFFSGLCGGPLTSPTGHFASPNYPRYYPNNAYCEWTILVPLGSVLKIDFLFFKTEEW